MATAAPQILTDISVSSAFSDEKSVFDTKDLVRIINKQPAPKTPPGAGTKFLYAVKPTVVIRSNLFGRQVIAPYGVPKKGEAAANIKRLKIGLGFIVLGLIGTGFVLGRIVR